MQARSPTPASSPIRTTTVFRSGNSQAVRIPKDFQLEASEVTIQRRGNELVLKPKARTLGELLRELPPATPREIAAVDMAVASRRELPHDREIDLDVPPASTAVMRKRTRKPAR